MTTSHSASDIARTFIQPAQRFSLLIGWLGRFRKQSCVYKAKKEWLENELKRARKAAIGSQTPELKEWFLRVEEFHREWFMKFEDTLHKAKSGPMWMKDEAVAAKVAENLHRLDGDAYRLDAYCVMSNHVHTVFTPSLSEAELQESLDEDGHLTLLSEHPGLSRSCNR